MKLPNSSPLPSRLFGAGTALAVVVACGFLAPPTFAETGSRDRFDRIERLLGELQTELDSLKRESRESAQEAKKRPAGEESILGELMTDRQKALARATRTEFRRVAAGYSFNAALPMGIHFLHWFDPWGVKLEGGAIITDYTRTAGVNAAALYSINRFSSLDLLETHLYALAGAGFYWRRVEDDIDVNLNWYGTPDSRIRGQLGVGTELSFFNLGGVRFVPETGLQVDRYITQYQDSPTYDSDPPKSSVFLNPFFAFHLSFYFR